MTVSRNASEINSVWGGGDSLLELTETHQLSKPSAHPIPPSLFSSPPPHKIARQIHISGTQLCLLLLDGKQYDQAVAQGCNLKTLARAQRGEDWDPPRLCHIPRDSEQGFGLRILPVEGKTQLKETLIFVVSSVYR